MVDKGVQLSKNRFADVLVLCPSGRLDQDTSSKFKARILQVISQESSPPPLIVLDMGAIEYISSIGLRAVMIAAKQCQVGNGCLSVANLTPVVSEIFEISRFNHIIDIFDDVRSAIASISAKGLESYDTTG